MGVQHPTVVQFGKPPILLGESVHVIRIARYSSWLCGESLEQALQGALCSSPDGKHAPELCAQSTPKLYSGCTSAIDIQHNPTHKKATAGLHAKAILTHLCLKRRNQARSPLLDALLVLPLCSTNKPDFTALPRVRTTPATPSSSSFSSHHPTPTPTESLALASKRTGSTISHAGATTSFPAPTCPTGGDNSLCRRRRKTRRERGHGGQSTVVRLSCSRPLSRLRARVQMARCNDSATRRGSGGRHVTPLATRDHRPRRGGGRRGDRGL